MSAQKKEFRKMMTQTVTDKTPFYFYESKSDDPYHNLAVEEHLFSSLPQSSSCLYLWQNNKTVVIGKYQNAIEEINRDYVLRHQIQVARRMSGGGAVYHDLGNLNYTLITEDLPGRSDSFDFFIEPVLRALHKLRIPAERTGRNDITVNGRKVSGCSQYKSGTRLLCHGCIMLDTDLGQLSKALNVNQLKIASYSTKSVSSHVDTINNVSPVRITMTQFKDALTREFLADTPCIFYEPTLDDLADIETLKKEKYSSWDWNYGHYFEYNIVREKKFPYGLVQIHMDVENARIQNIQIRGDFFGDRDIHDLERALTGLRLDNTLEHSLQSLNIPHFIHGMSVYDLTDLLT